MAIRPSVLRLLQRLTDLPTVVLSAKGDVLAQNPMACALLGDLSRWPDGRRNIIWQRILGTGHARVTLTRKEEAAWMQQAVGLLRTEERRSTVRRSMHKTIDHPEVGRLVLDCDTLLLPDTDQSMIVYSAAAGTREASALDVLRVIGTERISALPW
ncbi:hypothetical protein ACFU6S_25075 [Streptomyces sp. NPDC057456]|uniref:MmyB family transcriptional regulator n=1 Tax=Streptomyces sp. NPDC057456 TaxID=3346139 RepID=UPI0036820CAF